MIAMAAPTVDQYCQGFRPNSFDPSRCSSCLRPCHMHITVNSNSSAPDATAAAADDDEDNEDETKDYNKDDDADGGRWDGSQDWVRT